jgi:hypothetical protein
MAVLEGEFDCYGITEELDNSLLLFKQVLGWNKWPLYRSRNSSNSQSLLHFEPRHIARIETLNIIDLALYERALELFGQRLQTLCPDIDAQLVRFRAALRNRQSRFAVIDLARATGALTRRLLPRGSAAT